jgi:hypothetical protein
MQLLVQPRRILTVAVVAAATGAGFATARVAAPEPVPGPAAAHQPIPRAALDRLDRARILGRRELQRAPTPQRQAAAARELAAAHRGTAVPAIAAELSAAALAYHALARAAASRSAPRYRAAEVAVRATDARLTGAVTAVQSPGRARATAASGYAAWLLAPAALIALAAGVTAGFGTRLVPRRA